MLKNAFLPMLYNTIHRYTKILPKSHFKALSAPPRLINNTVLARISYRNFGFIRFYQVGRLQQRLVTATTYALPILTIGSRIHYKIDDVMFHDNSTCNTILQWVIRFEKPF